MSFQYLFHHITSTATTAIDIRYILCNRLNFRNCIFGTTRQPALTHHFYIRHIIAHIQNFVIRQTVFITEITVIMNFHRRTHIQILHTQCCKPDTYRFCPSTGNDSNMKSFLYRQLNGITVFDIHCTHRFSGRMQRDCCRTQYSVNIKSQCFDAG